MRLELEPGADGGETYSVDEAIEAVGFGRYQVGVLLMAGLCWTADAMEMLLLSYIKEPMKCEWGISDLEAASVASAVGFGMLAGSTFWGVVADSFGRPSQRPACSPLTRRSLRAGRFGFLAVAVFTFACGMASAFSNGLAMMIVARGLVGFGIGGVPVAFSLMMEFLPMAERGTWGMGIVIFWSGGAVFEALLAMEVMGAGWGWRWLVALSSMPLGVLLLLWPVLPESPRWLVAHGKTAEAQRILTAAAKRNGTSLPPGRLSGSVATLEGDSHGHGGSVGKEQLGSLLRPEVRRLSCSVWFLWFVSAFVYYGIVMVQTDLLAAEKDPNKDVCPSYRAEGLFDNCRGLRSQTDCEEEEGCSWMEGWGANPGEEATVAIQGWQAYIDGRVDFTQSAQGGVEAAVTLGYDPEHHDPVHSSPPARRSS